MADLSGPSVPLYSDEIDRRWRSTLVSFFLRRVRDRSDAEDLTQETFARAIHRLSSSQRTNIRSYLFTVGSNLLRDRARRAATHHLDEHESLSSTTANISALTEDRSPERVLLARESLQEAISALAELDERTRDIFILFRLENMRHREIAAIFGISVSAVEKQVVKATAHLAARLRQHD